MYDVLSAWPIIGDGANQVRYQKTKLAMAIRTQNTHYRLADIQARHWRALAEQGGVPEAFDIMVQLVEHVDTALEMVKKELPPDFPDRIWNSIRSGMLRHQQRFLDAMKQESK
jgi:serine/threonine-protein kinase HipA